MQPVNRISQLFTEFFNSEKASGFILIGCTAISLLLTNSSFGESYLSIWHQYAGGLSIEHWINDGLMAIFFLLVGLEIERELYDGELKNISNAMLPVFAAIGGMLIPAAIHFFFNNGSDGQNGFGIPMATDIAFALGILSLAGNKVPASLKIFLTALAIIDDLGAIIIIAVFYTNEFSLLNFGIAMGIFVLLLVLNRLKVHNLFFYIIPGIAMWYFMLRSGVHATISGVLLAFAIPFGDGKERSASYKLQHFLHKPVAFIVIPLFALANTGIHLESGFYKQLFSKNSLGIILGLVLGKPVGIITMSWIAVKTKLSGLPADINWIHLLGAGLLGGIGFTMSIFITLLAFPAGSLITDSKIAILTASVIAGVIGWGVLKSVKTESNR